MPAEEEEAAPSKVDTTTPVESVFVKSLRFISDSESVLPESFGVEDQLDLIACDMLLSLRFQMRFFRVSSPLKGRVFEKFMFPRYDSLD